MGDLTVTCDSGASCPMSHVSTGRINYCELNAYMRTASGAIYPVIEGYGSLLLTLLSSSSGDVPLLLGDEAHAPSLNYHIFSLRAVTENGHTYTGNHDGVNVFFATGKTLFSPYFRRLNFLYAYRSGMFVDETTNTTIAPGPTPSNCDTPVDINGLHVAHAHAHAYFGVLRRRSSKWASPSKESCIKARAAR